MDREELITQLQDFKAVCLNEGYISDDIYLDEAYPGVIPTSFIVNVIARPSWLSNFYKSSALDKLIDVLWKTTDVKTRESIFSLNMLTVEDMVNSEMLGDRKRIATNPELTPEQIKKLFHDKKTKIKYIVQKHIEESQLTDQQIQNFLDTQDSGIINLLKNRFETDANFKNLICSNRELKHAFLKLAA